MFDSVLNPYRRHALRQQIVGRPAVNAAMGYTNADATKIKLLQEVDEFVAEYPAMGAISELSDIIGTAKNLADNMGYKADEVESWFYAKLARRVKRALPIFVKTKNWQSAWVEVKRLESEGK